MQQDRHCDHSECEVEVGQRVIGVSVADQKSLFYIAAVDGMRKMAAQTGDKLIVLSADNNATQQVNQVNNLITQHVDALIYIAQDATSALAGVRAANRSGIPVIAVDEKPESGDAETGYLHRDGQCEGCGQPV